LFVVLNHVFYSTFLWYSPNGRTQPVGSWRWWISETPLHVIWAGPEMVLIFFVLSGYVLTLPALKRGEDWFRLSYYPRRVVRLYLPAWAAILFAAALHLLPDRHVIASSYVNQSLVPVTLQAVVHAGSLVGDGKYLVPFTTVLWSMKWEVIFSMLLPFVVGAASVARRSLTLAAIAAGVSLWSIQRFPAAGGPAQQAAHYLPYFMLGSLLAFSAPALQAAASRARHRVRAVPTWLRSILPIVSVVMLTTAAWHLNTDSGSTNGWSSVVIAIGACLMVWLAIANPLVVRAMSSRVSQWLGARSYSLYLIHQPIVFAIALALKNDNTTWLLLVTAVPASLVAGDLLWRLVERPAIVLSRRTAGAVDALSGPREPQRS
jgi:peptidoglycan/LPS O-acetylase OafA/YrhL